MWKRPDPCHIPPLHISKKRLTLGSKSQSQEAGFGVLSGGAQPSWWGRRGRRRRLSPPCAERAEAQGQGRRAEWGWRTQRTLAAQSSQSVFPDDLETPRASESGIKEVTGLPGAPLTLTPKDSRQFGYQLSHGTPGAEGLGSSAASGPERGPKCSKPRLGGGRGPLLLSDGETPSVTLKIWESLLTAP